MELRVQDGKAVLAGRDDAGEREVDPHALPLGAGLADALHEWAKVADAVARTDTPSDGTASALVTRRGRQLAGRLAADMRTAVEYTDPVTGELVVVEAPTESGTSEPTGSEAAEADAEPVDAEAGQGEPEPEEETPWGTGLTVTLITAAVVTFTVYTLSVGLGETSQWLALLANVLVVGGIAPSVWLARKTPVWRWVAYGVVTGVVVAWLSLLLNALL